MNKFYIVFASVLFSMQAFAQCTNLFFSEYVEGSSNNKALEIYNPTAVPVNMAGYKVILYTNGSATPTNTFNLSGTVAAGDVYVLVHASAGDSLKSKADTLLNGSAVNFNGNDAIALLSGTDTLDIIGQIGFDPGNNQGWTVDTVANATYNRTLVRVATVNSGTKNWTLSATQWRVFKQDTSYLGSHTMLPCNPITDTLARFSPTSAQVSESSGTYTVNVTLNATSPSSTFTAEVHLTGGTGSAADVNNFATQTLTFTPNTATQGVTITITDDAAIEGAETLVFTLRNASAPLKLGTDSVFTLTIGASDAPVQAFTISQITGMDTTNTPDSIGAKVRVTGTVLGIDYRANGVEFFIHDATDGILVFSPASTFNYTVAEGDSVMVEGEVGFFNGTTELQFLDTIIKIGTGTVPAPLVVQDLGESTEAELIRLNNVTLVNASQWTGTGASGFNVDITDGQNTWVLRIDEMCALYSAGAPSGTFDVIGLGSQNDNSSPYNSGYQIMPRVTTDIIEHNGINDVQIETMKAFPNPSNGSFIIETEEFVNGAQLQIVDLTGRVVVTENVSGERFNVNALFTAGTYLVQVKAATKVFRTRVNIQ
jgi:predicted extracellular nuclease